MEGIGLVDMPRRPCNDRRAPVLEKLTQDQDMQPDFKTFNIVSSNDAVGDCSGFMGFLQVALGILLITASAFGYSLMQHAALLIPAIMGAALLFYGLKAVQVCRSRSVSDNHQHQRNGAMG